MKHCQCCLRMLLAMTLVMVGFVGNPCVAQTPPPKTDVPPVDKPIKPPQSSNEDPCHGPYVKKLLAQDKEAKEAEIDQRILRDFFNDTGQTLESAHRAEQKRLSEERLAAYKQCLRDHKRPSIMCTVMSQRDPEGCQELVAKEDRATCFQLLTIGNAGADEDPKLCEIVEHSEVKAVCRFIATRQFDCQGLTVPEYRAVCQAVSDGLAGKSLPEGLGDAEKTGLYWLLAIIQGNAELCQQVPDGKEADGCRAAVARDSSVCPGIRPTVEFLDHDFSCRDVLMYQKLHKRAQGSELVLELGTPFRGTGNCTTTLHLKAQEKPVLRKLEPVVLGAEKTWQELRYRLVGETLHHVVVECTWDPVSSRYVLESKEQNDW